VREGRIRGATLASAHGVLPTASKENQPWIFAHDSNIAPPWGWLGYRCDDGPSRICR